MTEAYGIPWRAALGRRSRPALITLLTDFGAGDPYVGIMKGVIAAIAPRARVIDLTHAVPPQNIIAGGLRWAAAVPFFPRGSIHVAVVDPGVGGSRDILAVRSGGALYLAPDNGLIGFIIRESRVDGAVRVRESRYFLPRVSSTFHGRDIFAPVAARLALGLPLSRLGPPVSGFTPSPLPPVHRTGRPPGIQVRGEIVDIDNFGNCITNISRGERAFTFRDIRIGTLRFPEPSESYDTVPRGKPLVLVGSSGLLEIAVNCGRADRTLGLRCGRRVTALLLPERSSR